VENKGMYAAIHLENKIFINILQGYYVLARRSSASKNIATGEWEQSLFISVM
jgi:hypothetical protein